MVAPFDPFAKDLNLIVDPKRVGQLEAASAPDWQIMRVSAREELLPGGDPTDRRFVFEVGIRRLWNYYFYRVLFPMTFLVIATWTVFWFEPTNLQPQISTALAILLSFVTFNYAVDFSLPKVSYLTFIDRYALTSFGFVLAVTFAVSALHVLLREKGPDLALRLQRRARWGFPSPTSSRSSGKPCWHSGEPGTIRPATSTPPPTQTTSQSMLFLPFQILGLWLRGLLAVAILAGGVYGLWSWYDRSTVIEARPDPRRGRRAGEDRPRTSNLGSSSSGSASRGGSSTSARRGTAPRPYSRSGPAC